MKVLIRPACYDAMDGPVGEMLDSFPLPWKGASVLVKPNVLSPWTADAGVTTHPSVVRAIVRAIEARGAGRIWNVSSVSAFQPSCHHAVYGADVVLARPGWFVLIDGIIPAV